MLSLIKDAQPENIEQVYVKALPLVRSRTGW